MEAPKDIRTLSCLFVPDYETADPQVDTWIWLGDTFVRVKKVTAESISGWVMRSDGYMKHRTRQAGEKFMVYRIV